MKNNEVIELNGGVKLENNVEGLVKTVGVRGLDIHKAKELGVFQHISLLLCSMHTTVCAAYKIFSGVDYLLSEVGAKKHEIKKACNDFEIAFDKFFRFFKNYYIDDGESEWDRNIEVANDVENLYHKIMEWSQLPENWQLGDEQRTRNANDEIIKVQADDITLVFNKCELKRELVGEIKESWCVTKYDVHDHSQTTVNTDMDKASAIMVAKRLSAEDEKNFYTATTIREYTETKSEAIPFRVFRGNKTVGKHKKILK